MLQILDMEKMNMNKYQLEFWKNLTIKEESTDQKLESFIIENDNLRLKQNKNYNINKYNFYIDGISISSVERIEALKGKSWKEIGKTKFTLDFSDKYKKIRICLKDSVVEPIVFDVIMEDADKQIYNQEMILLTKEQDDKIVSLEVASGYNLINVYFSKVNEKYQYSLIKLFKNNRQIGVYKEEGTNFVAIPNVASGEYEVSIEQYDSNKKLIYSSNKRKKVSVNDVSHPQPPIR